MPLGKAMSSATRRAEPSGVIRATLPGGKGVLLGYRGSRAVGGDQSDAAGSELGARHHVEAGAVHVGVAATVHDELVPRRGIEDAPQVAGGHQRAVGLAAQEKPLARRDEQQTPVRQPVDTAGKRPRPEDDLAVALEIDCNDLWRTPVGKPKTILMPTWLLPEHDAGHQGLQFSH